MELVEQSGAEGRATTMVLADAPQWPACDMVGAGSAALQWVVQSADPASPTDLFFPVVGRLPVGSLTSLPSVASPQRLFSAPQSPYRPPAASDPPPLIPPPHGLRLNG